MAIFYVEEHFNCINYQECEKSAIDIIEIKEGETRNSVSGFNQIIFILTGSISYTTDNQNNLKKESSKAILLPANTPITIKSEGGAKLIAIRITGISKLCDAYALTKLLYTEKYNPKNRLATLEITPMLQTFLDMLYQFISDGIRCGSYFDSKIKEMFLILRTYYEKSDILHFLYPLLSNDMAFSDIILSNYTRVKTVSELAELTNYSLSGFQKKFKKVFNMPAHQWLTEQRMKAIFQDINNPEIALKEICSKFQFSSISYFNDFCKMQFGKTPGQLRKEIKK